MLLKGILQLTKGGSFGRRLLTVGNRYRFGKQEKDYGIKFDEEQIKKKIDEIKSRKQKVKGKVQEKLNFMRINTNNQILRKVRKFREQTGTQNLLHFSDPTVEEKPTYKHNYVALFRLLATIKTVLRWTQCPIHLQ